MRSGDDTVKLIRPVKQPLSGSRSLTYKCVATYYRSQTLRQVAASSEWSLVGHKLGRRHVT
jgi:hypothetical protein